MNKKLPQNIEAEEVVLGLMMLSRTCLAEGISGLTDNDFHKNTHALIFKGVQGLFEAGKEVGLISLTEQLKSTNSLSAVGGELKLAELTESSISDTEFSTYIEILKDKSVKRSIIKATNVISKMGYEDRIGKDDFLKQSMEAIWQATPYYSSDIRIITSGGVYEARMANLKDRMTQRTIEFGWPNLDELVVSGLAPGDISILAARPGMGKSAVKTNLIYNLLKSGKAVVSFALEQGFGTEQDRLESIMTNIPLQEIITSRNWKKGDYRINLIKEANDKMDKEFKYSIIPSRGVAVADVRSVLYRITQQHHVDIVFFDLFDKLIDVNVSLNKAQTVGVKLGELARIAEEFNCHICCLVQINRGVEKRSDKRPKMSDLKDSGAFDEVARLIILLYREKYYFQDSMNDELEVIVSKQSNGPTGTAIMTFNESTLAVKPKEEETTFA